jgi:PIN domain nuclease of toxin-antitoxin system
MRVLLDTRLLLWALSSPEKLSRRARQRIDSSEVYASAASIWEISIKCALGKLEADPDEVLGGVEPAGFNHLSIVGGHAAKVAGAATETSSKTVIRAVMSTSLLREGFARTCSDFPQNFRVSRSLNISLF